MRGGGLRDRRDGLRGGREVHRGTAANAAKECGRPQILEHSASGVGVDGGERERDVLEHLGVDAAEADHGDGAEPRVALDTDDELDPVAQVRH